MVIIIGAGQDEFAGREAVLFWGRGGIDGFMGLSDVLFCGFGEVIFCGGGGRILFVGIAMPLDAEELLLESPELVIFWGEGGCTLFEGIATPLGAEELLLLIGAETIVMFLVEDGDSDVTFCVDMVIFLIEDGEMEVPF